MCKALHLGTTASCVQNQAGSVPHEHLPNSNRVRSNPHRPIGARRLTLSIQPGLTMVSHRIRR